ncbi:hypothetical protein N7507_010119 [Penicillium longicatenatum]|nr:hypothetical protein N7507_010119 [Penicillium longicatenatum]
MLVVRPGWISRGSQPVLSLDRATLKWLTLDPLIAILNLVHTTIGCGEQGFPSAQPYLSHTPVRNSPCRPTLQPFRLNAPRTNCCLTSEFPARLLHVSCTFDVAPGQTFPCLHLYARS